MAIHSDYSVVANALVVNLNDAVANGVPGTGFNGVPAIFKNFVPESLVLALAGELAKTAVDTLDQHRAKSSVEWQST